MTVSSTQPTALQRESYARSKARSQPNLSSCSVDAALSRVRGLVQRRFRDIFLHSQSFMEEKLQMGNEIGHGSFARVYRGQYLQDTVAVKVFNDGDGIHWSNNPQLEADIESEAAIIEQKRSKYIVRLLHYSKQKKWIVTEYCANGSLHDVMRDALKREIVEDWSSRLKWMHQVALGMCVVHDQPPTVLHRDLKPSNIFLDEHFDAKVGDFGLSKQLRCEMDVSAVESGIHLRMIWQPLEVITVKEYSMKSDVYSFGVIMHEMLMLEGPYGFSSSVPYVEVEIHRHVREGGGFPIPDDRSQIPGKWNPCLEDYIALIHRCVASNPRERPPFAEISRILGAIREKYKNNHQLEEMYTPLLTQLSIVKASVLITLMMCCSALVIYSVKHLKSDKGANNEESNDDNSKKEKILVAEFMIGLTGLFFVFFLLICLLWKLVKPEWLAIRCGLTGMKYFIISGASSLRSFRTKEPKKPMAAVKSPFASGPVSRALHPNAANMTYSISPPPPPPHIWQEIRQSFICEYKEEEVPPFMRAVIQFCRQHGEDQLGEMDWESFLRILNKQNAMQRSSTWRVYQEYFTGPIIQPSVYIDMPKAESAQLPQTQKNDGSFCEILPEDNRVQSVPDLKLVSGLPPYEHVMCTNSKDQEPKAVETSLELSPHRAIYDAVLSTLTEGASVRGSASNWSDYH